MTGRTRLRAIGVTVLVGVTASLTSAFLSPTPTSGAAAPSTTASVADTTSTATSVAAAAPTTTTVAGAPAATATATGAPPTPTTVAGAPAAAADVALTPPVVELTQTLQVASGTVIRDKHFVWAGPSDAPMVRLTGASFASLENLTFDVPAGRHATVAIELANSPAGGPLGNSLANLRIGTVGQQANLDYGIRWVDAVNGDSNTVSNVSIFGAARAGVSVSNPQATGNTLRGVYVFNSPIGLQSAAGGAVTCENCGFIGSTDVDVELTNGATLIINGFYSEQSHSFARIVAGPGAGGLTVTGGYWQQGPKASGATFTGKNMCCFRSWLRLQDFMITPLNPGPYGTVVGIPVEKQFFSNVAGIAGA